MVGKKNQTLFKKKQTKKSLFFTPEVNQCDLSVLSVASLLMFVSLGTRRAAEVGGSGELWGFPARDAASHGSP